MPKYSIICSVNQIVTKEIHMTVEAETPDEAELKARGALQTYPDKVKEEGIFKMLTKKSRYWIPRDIEFKKVFEIVDPPVRRA